MIHLAESSHEIPLVIVQNHGAPTMKTVDTGIPGQDLSDNFKDLIRLSLFEPDAAHSELCDDIVRIAFEAIFPIGNSPIQRFGRPKW